MGDLSIFHAFKDVDANDELIPAVLALLEDLDQQQTLSENIGKLAKPEAAKDIALEIKRMIA